jgi:hypothetical protein
METGLQLEMSFKEGKMTHNSLISFPKSFFQSSLSFVAAFIIVYSFYSLLDTLINSGLTIWQGNSIWSHAIIDPTVLSLGLGVFFLGIKENQSKSILFGIIVFLSSLLVFRLWIWLLPLDELMKFNPTIIPFFFPLHEALVGIIIGAIIGCMKAGWNKSIWYALAGAIGMTTGFLIMDIVGKTILTHSPFATGISLLVVGSTWYYLYFILPAMIQGLVLGIFIGFAELAVRIEFNTPKILSSASPH